MKILKISCLLLGIAYGIQTISAQPYRHVLTSGKEMKITINRTALNFMLDVIVNNCEIDGWIKAFRGTDSNNIEYQTTYHVICDNGQWVWGCGGACFSQSFCDNTGLTMQDLLNMASQVPGTDTCCRGNGSGENPCDTTKIDIENPRNYGFCNHIDIVCCGNAMKIIYTQYNCNDSTNVIFTDVFWALYNGDGESYSNISDYTIIGLQGILSEDHRNYILNHVINYLNYGSNPCINTTNSEEN